MAHKHSFTMMFSSEQSSRRTHISEDGSEMIVFFEPPLAIPAKAKNCTVSLVSASIMNSFDNVIKGQTDKIWIKKATNGYQYFEIPEGMYSVSDLSDAINTLLKKSTHVDFVGVVEDFIEIKPNYNTNNISFRVLLDGYTVKFSENEQSFHTLLGFTTHATIVKSDGFIESELENSFGDFTRLVIRSTLSKSWFNGTTSNILDIFDMTSNIGFINVYSPYYLNKSNGAQLVGKETTDCVFTIENPSGKRPRISDPWNITLEVAYEHTSDDYD